MKEEDKIKQLPKNLYIISKLAKKFFDYDETHHVIVKPEITVAVHPESSAAIQQASEAAYQRFVSLYIVEDNKITLTANPTLIEDAIDPEIKKQVGSTIKLYEKDPEKIVRTLVKNKPARDVVHRLAFEKWSLKYFMNGDTNCGGGSLLIKNGILTVQGNSTANFSFFNIDPIAEIIMMYHTVRNLQDCYNIDGRYIRKVSTDPFAISRRLPIKVMEVFSKKYKEIIIKKTGLDVIEEKDKDEIFIPLDELTNEDKAQIKELLEKVKADYPQDERDWQIIINDRNRLLASLLKTISISCVLAFTTVDEFTKWIESGDLASCLYDDDVIEKSLEIIKNFGLNDLNLNSAMPGAAGSSPLILAATTGKLNIIQALLNFRFVKEDCQVKINYQNEAGDTALICAVREKHTQVVEKLLEEKADAAIVNRKNQGALHIAVRNNDIAMTQLLLEKNPGLLESKEYKMILKDAIEIHNAQLANILIEYKANLDKRDADQNTPLSLAVKKGNLDIVNIIVKALRNKISSVISDFSLYKGDSFLNEQYSNGDTLLHIAIKYRKVEVVKYLLKRAIKVDTIVNNDGKTPFQQAVDMKAHEVVDTLIKNGYSINKADNEYAFKYANDEILKLLIPELDRRDLNDLHENRLKEFSPLIQSVIHAAFIKTSRALTPF